jgi:hypothetical protein
VRRGPARAGGASGALDPEEEAWRRLQHQARIRSLVLVRSDARDGPIRFVTVRRGTELRLHDCEEDLMLYFRSTK